MCHKIPLTRTEATLSPDGQVRQVKRILRFSTDFPSAR